MSRYKDYSIKYMVTTATEMGNEPPSNEEDRLKSSCATTEKQQMRGRQDRGKHRREKGKQIWNKVSVDGNRVNKY